jgi:hypothetical protein
MFKNKNGCFSCDKCPQNNDSTKGRYCVAWYERPGFINGKPEIKRGCGFPVIFDLLTDNCKATDVMTANLTNFPARIKAALINVLQQTKQLR